ncbi:hypothetical protein GCM10018793_05850 [Streptomyces sulfonofaciens]|uniref:Uncharacterized protein n=1 Tax=Streptomyces sulfonofaciens TaxID=68272 RepID=A0A919FR69_9ACTN|nr:hypothetical protein GCM10018793_05850 [Streptomyces sulfonofaciens]
MGDAAAPPVEPRLPPLTRADRPRGRGVTAPPRHLGTRPPSHASEFPPARLDRTGTRRARISRDTAGRRRPHTAHRALPKHTPRIRGHTARLRGTPPVPRT